MYVAACKNKSLQPGKLLVVKEQTLNGEKIIINFPTKTEWRLKSKYGYVQEGLRFQSALSLEILATVVFIQKEKPGINKDDVIKTIHARCDRKQKLFQEKYIDIAIHRLDSYGIRSILPDLIN